VEDTLTEGSERSYAPLTDNHLKRLARIAQLDHESMFEKNRHLEVYRDRVLLVALCQGAALHYIDGKNGVKDIDVYTFYANFPGVMIHPLRHAFADFGESELGYRPADKPHRGKRYVGRRIDLLQRGLKVLPDADPVEAVRDWLLSKGESPWWLRQKAVVGLWPEKYLGTVIWPV
jgi:hypothetical protein